MQEITLPEINRLLKKIDKHSFAELNFEHQKESLPRSLPKIETKHFPNDVGYLKLDGFYSPDDNQEAYFENYKDIVAGLNSIKDSEGLILDLSENSGGNMYPWFGALAPLFDSKIVGYFKYVYKGEKDGWILKPDGVYCGDKKWFKEVNPNEYSFRRIALLISNKTSSSGEAISIAFKGQSNAKLFGRPTAGFTTGNESYKNGDVVIWLSTCVMQDRNGVSYESSVNPDLDSETPIIDANSWFSL